VIYPSIILEQTYALLSYIEIEAKALIEQIQLQVVLKLCQEAHIELAE